MSHINVLTQNDCLYIEINRPYKGNALAEQTIDDMLIAFNQAKLEKNLKCIVIRSKGKNFCTGIDLNWMHECSQMSWEDNLAASQKIADLLKSIKQTPIPKIAMIQGNVMGGGIGIVACCNIVLAEENTIFSLPELNLGITPAIIYPYLAQAIGSRKTETYTLLTKTWSAKQALIDGLIYSIETPNNLEQACQIIIDQILKHPTSSVQKFMNYVNDSADLSKICELSAGILAKTRAEIIVKNKLAQFIEKKCNT